MAGLSKTGDFVDEVDVASLSGAPARCHERDSHGKGNDKWWVEEEEEEEGEVEKPTIKPLVFAFFGSSTIGVFGRGPPLPQDLAFLSWLKPTLATTHSELCRRPIGLHTRPGVNAIGKGAVHGSGTSLSGKQIFLIQYTTSNFHQKPVGFPLEKAC